MKKESESHLTAMLNIVTFYLTACVPAHLCGGKWDNI